MFVQFDADNLAYSIGYSLESKGAHGLVKSFVTKRVNSMINKVSNVGKVTELVFYLTSNDRTNYRFGISEDYKANRIGKSKPLYYYEVREFLLDYYDAEVVSGMEADDMLSINAWEYYRNGKKNKICVTISNDKDLRIAPGLHYEMGDAPVYESHMPGYLSLYRTSKAINCFGTSIVWFYYQLLVGDNIDNVKRTVSNTEAYHLLKYEKEPKEMYKIVLEQYELNDLTKEHLLQNARLLWLKTSKDEPLWEPPL